MQQDRLEHGPHLVAARDVQRLERLAVRGRGRRRDEVAPQLGDEERRVQRVPDAHRQTLLPRPRARLAEDRLVAVVVPRGHVAEVVHAELVAPLEVEAGQRAGELAHVVLGVGAAVGAEREQLHQLARVVLVRVPARVLVQVEPRDHRRVLRHVVGELVEGPERAAAEERVLLEHQALLAHSVVRGREPVVPDERHPLHERLARAHHPVEPPQVVVSVGVRRGQRVAVAVGRLGAGERRLADRPGECSDRAVQPQRREQLGVSGRGAEAGAPQEPLGLADAERAGVDGDRAGEPEQGRGRRRGRRRDRLELGLARAARLYALHAGVLAQLPAPPARRARFGLSGTALTAPRGGAGRWVHRVPIGGDSGAH